MLAGVSRAGFYRWLRAVAPVEEEMDVRTAIHQVALEHRGRYGYRRVSRELRRRGLVVNHKRVARLMREDNLLAVQPRAWVQTTDSNHDLKVYLNLAVRMQLSGINQLWVADITYIRLQTEFVYLAVVLDAFSRKVVGWALGRSLAEQLPMSAGAGHRATPAAARAGASLRSWQSVCLPGVCEPASKPGHTAQHEPARQPLRQRQLRELHAHSQAGRDLRQYLPRSANEKARKSVTGSMAPVLPGEPSFFLRAYCSCLGVHQSFQPIMQPGRGLQYYPS